LRLKAAATRKHRPEESNDGLFVAKGDERIDLRRTP
jgi:hypothetical protein